MHLNEPYEPVELVVNLQDERALTTPKLLESTHRRTTMTQMKRPQIDSPETERRTRLFPVIAKYMEKVLDVDSIISKRAYHKSGRGRAVSML